MARRARERVPALGRAIVAACRRLDDKGLLAGAEGNLSARVGATRLLVTPAGRGKGRLTAAALVEVTLDGGRVRGSGRPSSELAMHLAIYSARPDVRAVVHAHPVGATAFAVARRTIPRGLLAEVAGVIGPIPLVPYRQPGTAALGSAVAASLAAANVALLASHGAVAVGPTVDVALHRMESLEQAARTIVVARMLGRNVQLADVEVDALDRAWRNGAGIGLAPRSARRRRN